MCAEPTPILLLLQIWRKLNEIIFGKKTENQKFKSYKRSDILKILDYQKKYKLNNSQLANHFNISRNTVTKWKKMFLT